ncbi:unnamed protein product [Lactuca virosa]|uniref:Uncharacterized protein n=1 Tax=Lactuca virosa TaxID=75947 RepID=A0AAU9LSU4_9ASTR|nr:unnamed protein product [Lactuca virosa]
MVSGPIQDESMPTRTSNWACVLEAAAQRRTEVLQPENLENMWTKGRNYMKKSQKNSTSFSIKGGINENLNPDIGRIPKIEKLEIEGKGFHTNLYAVRGNYSGGKEGEIGRIIKHMINLFGLGLSVAPSPAPALPPSFSSIMQRLRSMW